jgi:hypothetical protein
MATIVRVYTDLANVFTNEEIAAADGGAMNRKSNFIPEATFGGEKDTYGGKWTVGNVGVIIKEKGEIVRNEDGTPKQRVVKGLIYQIEKEGEEPVVLDSLSKSFLNKIDPDIDVNGVAHHQVGDIRTWCRTNVLAGELDVEWMPRLAALLNTRGMKMHWDYFQRATKDGKPWSTHSMHPFFADTYKEETK